MKLRRDFIVFIAAGTVLAGAFLAAPRFLRSTLVSSIEKSLPGSTVRIGSCRLTFRHGLLLQDVRVSLQSSKNFPAPKLPSGKNPFSFLLPPVTVQGLRLDIKSADLRMEGTFAFVWLPGPSAVKNLTLDIPSLSLGRFKVKNLRASSDKPGAGRFAADSLAMDRFSAGNIQGLFRLSGAGASLDELSADFLGGKVTGRVTLARLEDAPVGTAELELDALPIASFLKLWEWDKKMGADGIVRGQLIAEASGGKLTHLNGALVASGDGSLVILDQAFLENIAQRTKQPISIVKASFENYHYNTGTIGVSLEEEGLRLQLDLDGEKGKRNLEVTLHDWF